MVFSFILLLNFVYSIRDFQLLTFSFPIDFFYTDCINYTCFQLRLKCCKVFAWFVLLVQNKREKIIMIIIWMLNTKREEETVLFCPLHIYNLYNLFLLLMYEYTCCSWFISNAHFYYLNNLHVLRVCVCVCTCVLTISLCVCVSIAYSHPTTFSIPISLSITVFKTESFD